MILYKVIDTETGKEVVAKFPQELHAAVRLILDYSAGLGGGLLEINNSGEVSKVNNLAIFNAIKNSNNDVLGMDEDGVVKNLGQMPSITLPKDELGAGLIYVYNEATNTFGYIPIYCYASGGRIVLEMNGDIVAERSITTGDLIADRISVTGTITAEQSITAGDLVADRIFARSSFITLANGENNNVNIANSFIRLITNTSDCYISGFASGTDGQILNIFCAIGQNAVTLRNQSTLSDAANRLYLGASAIITCERAQFQYSSSESRWILLNYF